MKETCKHYAWLGAIAGAIFFVNLGGPKLWDRDEPRNAGCAREMLERNDWVVPMFNNELRVHKPVLLYWFMMTAYAMFEDQELAARFWSAVCGLGTCPPEKLHSAIVPADWIYVELGDDRRNGQEECRILARLRLFRHYTRTGSHEPAREADAYDHAAREYR